MNNVNSKNKKKYHTTSQKFADWVNKQPHPIPHSTWLKFSTFKLQHGSNFQPQKLWKVLDFIPWKEKCFYDGFQFYFCSQKKNLNFVVHSSTQNQQ